MRDRLSFDCAAIQVPLDYAEARPAPRSPCSWSRCTTSATPAAPARCWSIPAAPAARASSSPSGIRRRSRTPCCPTSTSSASTRAASARPRRSRCVSDAQKDALNAAQPDVRTTAGLRRRPRPLAARSPSACSAKYGSALAQTTTPCRPRATWTRSARPSATRKMNYLGFSYGTELGAQYAHLFPQHDPRHGARRRGRPADRRHHLLRQPAAGLRGRLRPVRGLVHGSTAPCQQLGDPREAVYNIVAAARAHPIPSALAGRDPQGDQLARLHRRAVGAVLAVAVADARPGADRRAQRRLRRACSHWPTSTTSATTATTRTSPTPTRRSAATTPSPARRDAADPRDRGKPGSSGSRSSGCGRRRRCSPASSGSPTAPSRRCPPRRTAADDPGRSATCTTRRRRTRARRTSPRRSATPSCSAGTARATRPTCRAAAASTATSNAYLIARHAAAAATRPAPDEPTRTLPARRRRRRRSGATAPSRWCCTAGGPPARRPVRARQLAVLRMRPFARSLHAGRRERRAGGGPAAVPRARLERRGPVARSPTCGGRWTGWPSASRTRPVALVGHSMGGRAALYAADHPAVRAVVGLAPWIEPGDPVAQLARPPTARRCTATATG